MKKIFTIMAAMLLSVTALNAEVIWNGGDTTHNVGKWNALQLPVSTYTKLGTASAGDALVINVKEVETGARITLQSINWKGWVDEYNVTAGKHVFVLTEATADSVRNGLIVTGEKYKFNKVELLYRENLWSGNLGKDQDWAQSDNLGNAIFTSLKAGDFLGISCKDLTDTISEWGHACVLRINYRTNIIDKWVNAAGTYTHELTAADVDSLQNKTDINLVARWLTITALDTYTATKKATAIENTSIQKAGVKVMRDGVMYIRRGETLYNMQGQVVK